jgi:hypothetical protein
MHPSRVVYVYTSRDMHPYREERERERERERVSQTYMIDAKDGEGAVAEALDAVRVCGSRQIL